jgi:hypothetical protein
MFVPLKWCQVSQVLDKSSKDVYNFVMGIHNRVLDKSGFQINQLSLHVSKIKLKRLQTNKVGLAKQAHTNI